MSCTTGIDPSCNELFQGKEGMPTIDLVFGYYIN